MINGVEDRNTASSQCIKPALKLTIAEYGRFDPATES
jgi:hypothetical protein